MFKLSEKTKQIIQQTSGLTWEEILRTKIPKIKK